MRAGRAGTIRAQKLRRNMTDADQRLWYRLRAGQLGWRFRRQHPIPPYYADCACIEARLVVEADGGQHNRPGNHAARDAFLRRRGWRVLRFWNNDIFENSEGVLMAIIEALGPHPALPRERGRDS